MSQCSAYGLLRVICLMLFSGNSHPLVGENTGTCHFNHNFNVRLGHALQEIRPGLSHWRKSKIK